MQEKESMRAFCNRRSAAALMPEPARFWAAAAGLARPEALLAAPSAFDKGIICAACSPQMQPAPPLSSLLRHGWKTEQSCMQNPLRMRNRRQPCALQLSAGQVRKG